MLVIISFLALLMLAWIALALKDVRSALSEDDKYNDIPYPAVSRRRMRHTSEALQNALKESLREEERLYNSKRWEEICANPGLINDADKKAAYEVTYKFLLWKEALICEQFLLEANCRVQRGEWTVA
jgi:hypothetical protein